MLLYHGTLKDRVPAILSEGLKKGFGWGGYGSEGVFLAPTVDVAMTWAKIAAVHAYNEDSDESLDDDEYDRLPSKWKRATVLEVKIPDAYVSKLLPDVEQAEDYGFDPEEVTLEESLGYGAAMYPGNVPKSWVSSMPIGRRSSRRPKRASRRSR